MGGVSKLVSWYFEPSQPQRVTSWLKTMFNLSPIYSAHKSSNHKLSINMEIWVVGVGVDARCRCG